MTHAAGWYPDGTGRHAQRYFDGSAWTDHVADAAGRQSIDQVVAPVAVTAPRPPVPAGGAGWSPIAGDASDAGADRVALVASAVVGAFALWHLLGLFVAPDGAGMAVTGLLGFVGLAAVAAAPFLRRPLGAVTR